MLFCSALLLATTVSAALDDLNLYNQEDTQDSMAWPMLPNESLSDLAAKFYPNNKVMQRKFIEKTKQLNKDNKLALNPRVQDAKLTAIVIPNLESLSVNAGVIKRAKKKDLRLSYNIKSTTEKAKETFKNIPARLMREYEELVVRNTFLKEEIAKLNQRLIFLQNKLGELKLVLDRTLTLPAPKKALKNLDAEKVVAPKPIAKPANKTVEPASKPAPEVKTSFFDLSNIFLWITLLVLGLLVLLISYAYKQYKERKYRQLVDSISQQNQARTFSMVESNDSLEQGELNTETTIDKDTLVEEQDGDSIVHEAKMLAAQNSADEAIEHLKWAIKAKPKVGINVWLFLLELLRKENLKDAFEKFAYQMHQNFNVMTPLWEERAVAMVVAESLEEFPYIVKFLTDKWPDQKMIPYLEKLINDNRNGERSGFSKAVIDEILLLIVVLKARE